MLLRFFHGCDNSNLPPKDKFGNVRPLLGYDECQMAKILSLGLTFIH